MHMPRTRPKRRATSMLLSITVLAGALALSGDVISSSAVEPVDPYAEARWQNVQIKRCPANGLGRSAGWPISCTFVPRDVNGAPYNPDDPALALPDGSFAPVDPATASEGWTAPNPSGGVMVNCSATTATLTIGQEETKGSLSLARNSVEAGVSFDFESPAWYASLSVYYRVTWERSTWTRQSIAHTTNVQAGPYTSAYITRRWYQLVRHGFWWVQYDKKITTPDGTKTQSVYIPDTIVTPAPSSSGATFDDAIHRVPLRPDELFGDTVSGVTACPGVTGEVLANQSLSAAATMPTCLSDLEALIVTRCSIRPPEASAVAAAQRIVLQPIDNPNADGDRSVMIVGLSSKQCLRPAPDGGIDFVDCDHLDDAQTWRQSPVGSGRWQFQNPQVKGCLGVAAGTTSGLVVDGFQDQSRGLMALTACDDESTKWAVGTTDLDLGS